VTSDCVEAIFVAGGEDVGMISVQRESKQDSESVILDLSVAARAYLVALRLLRLMQERVGSPHFHEQSLATDQLLLMAHTHVEGLMAQMDLRWHSVPVARFLHAQLDLLHDTLEYARPEAVRGYGDLDAAVGAYLDRRYPLTGGMLDELAQLIERQNADSISDAERLTEAQRAGGTLTANQRIAVRSCLLSLARELLLLEAYALAAAPPTPSVFSSPYRTTQISRILAQAQRLEASLEVTGAGLAVAVPWTAASASILITCTARAEESAQRVLHEVSRVSGPHRQESAAFYRAAHAAYRAALDF
jgi:hypothetical protein